MPDLTVAPKKQEVIFLPYELTLRIVQREERIVELRGKYGRKGKRGGSSKSPSSGGSQTSTKYPKVVVATAKKYKFTKDEEGFFKRSGDRQANISFDYDENERPIINILINSGSSTKSYQDIEKTIIVKTDADIEKAFSFASKKLKGNK